jgi:hypothetical protein
MPAITCHLCGAARPLAEFDRLPGRAGDDARFDHCRRHGDGDGCGIIDAGTGTPLCGEFNEEAAVRCLLDDPHLRDHCGLGVTWPQD